MIHGKMEAIFQRLEMHMTFICPECGQTFELQQQWRQHLNFHHDYLCKTPEDFGFVEINERYHECLECNQLVADGKRAIALLQYHRFVHLPHKCTYRCRHCSGTFMRKRLCFSHLCRVHEDIVGKKLAVAAMKSPMLTNKKDNNNVNKHSNSSSIARHNPEFYLRCICPQCGYEVNTCDDWLRHIDEAHRLSLKPNNALEKIDGTEDFICTICEKIIYSSDMEKHQRHYFMHLPHKLFFRCAYCRIRRPFKTEILHHFMTTHLLVFETQRIYMKKPKEFGHEVSRKLDRELDFLLKYGNNVGAPQGSTWPKLATNNATSSSNSSSSSSNTRSQSKQHSLTPAANKTTAEKSGIIKTGKVSSQPTEHTSRTSNIKKELDALCAEIFRDIEENDDKSIDENGIESAENTQFLTSDDCLLQAESIQQAINEENLNSSKKSKKQLKDEDELVSIEIDTLDENELNQINKKNDNENDFTELLRRSSCVKRQRLNDDSSIKVDNPELYLNLKALYNAKVLHLCPQCGISFAEQYIWREHVLNTHEDLYKSVEQSYKLLDDQSNLCLTCNQVLYTTARTELQRHRFTHMPFSAYLKCILCEKCEVSKPQMLEHLENNHADYLKSVHDHYKTLPERQNLNRPEKISNSKQTSFQISTVQARRDDNDYVPLLTHLQNARERLNRMAAQYGIV